MVNITLPRTAVPAFDTRQAGIVVGHIVGLLFVLAVIALSLGAMLGQPDPACADTLCGPY